MAHRLDYPIQQLQILLEKPFSVYEGFRPVRDAARNIVYRYADENFKARFRSHTTFKSIYDARSDEEKYRLILSAIKNAIHYFEVWQASEQQAQPINPTPEITKEPVVQYITAENLFQNTNSNVMEQSGSTGQGRVQEKSTWIYPLMIGIAFAAIAGGGYLLLRFIMG